MKTATSIRLSVGVMVLLLCSIILIGCSGPPHGRSPSEEWVELTTLVDGVIEIQAAFPRPGNNRWTTKTQFVGSAANKLTRIFVLSYDPGRGRMDGAVWVHMFGYVFRIERGEGNNQPLDFEELMEIVYLSDPDDKGDYEIVGSEFVGKDEWYRVNSEVEYPAEGVFYYKLISDEYALSVSLEMFGEDSDKTNLYQQRYEDFLKALGSVKVTIADFANQSNRPSANQFD